MGDKQYVVLFTSQKSKKAKTWHDGTLRLPLNGSKAVLYDDKKSKLDSIHLRADEIVTGEQLESDRYLILVEELIKTSTADSSLNNEAKTSVNNNTLTAPVNNANRRPLNSTVTAPVNNATKRPLRTGLKRKNTGFVPPRMVKQPRQDRAENVITSNDISESQNPASTWLSQNPFKQDRTPLQSPNRQDIFSLYAKNNDRVSINTKESPKFESEVPSSVFGNYNPTNSNKHHEVIKSPWSTYGNVKLKSKQSDNVTNNGGSSQNDKNTCNDGSQGSLCDNSQQNSVLTINSFDKVIPESKNKHTNRLESQTTDISLSGITEQTSHVQGKRTASQIMALLKPKSIKNKIEENLSNKSSPSAWSDASSYCIDTETRGNMSSNKRISTQSTDDTTEDFEENSLCEKTSKHCSTIQMTNHTGIICKPVSVFEEDQALRNGEKIKHEQVLIESTDYCDSSAHEMPGNFNTKSNILGLHGHFVDELKNGHCALRRVKSEEEENMEMNMKEKEDMDKKKTDKKEMNDNQGNEEEDNGDDEEEDLGDPYFQISFSPLSQVTDSDDENIIKNSDTTVNNNSDLCTIYNENTNSSNSDGLINCETENDKALVSQKMIEHYDEQHNTDFNENGTDSAVVSNSTEMCLNTESKIRKSQESQNEIQVHQNVSYNYLEGLNFSQDSLRAQSLNSQDNFNKISYDQPAKNIKTKPDHEDRFKSIISVEKTNTVKHSDSSVPFSEIGYVSDSQSSQLSLEHTLIRTGNQTEPVSGLQIPFAKFKHSNDLADKSCDSEMEPNINSNMTNDEIKSYGNSNIGEELDDNILKDISYDEYINKNIQVKNEELVNKVSNLPVTECVEKENFSISNKKFLSYKNVSEEFHMKDLTDTSESRDMQGNFDDAEAQEYFSGKTSTCSSNYSEIIPCQDKTKYAGKNDYDIFHSVPNFESDLCHNDSSELLVENRFLQTFKDFSQNENRNTASLSKNQSLVVRGHSQTHFKDVRQNFKKQPSSVNSLPHPSEVFGVTDKHKVKPVVEKEDLSTVVNKKLDNYRIRGSISGCAAKRTSSDPDYLSQSNFRNTPRDTYFLSSQSISGNSSVADVSHSLPNFHSPLAVLKSPHQWTENYDETSMYIDWNDGKPRLRGLEHITNDSDKQVSRSPLQFVPQFKTSVESPDLFSQQVPCNKEKVFHNHLTGKSKESNDTYIKGDSEDPFTVFIKEHNRHEGDHTTLISKEQLNKHVWSEKSEAFKKSYRNDSSYDEMEMPWYNCQTVNIDKNKTVFADFDQKFNEELALNYTHSQHKQNNSDTHKFNNNKHDSKGRKALKSKPFDDPVTHTSYNSFYFSPTKTPLNEQSSRHDHTDEKSDIFDSSLNLSLEISTPQLASEPSEEHGKNVNCDDVSSGNSILHMLRAPLSNQDTQGTVYENSPRLKHTNRKNDYPHVFKNSLDGSPSSLTTSVDEELGNRIIFTDNADNGRSDEILAYNDQSKHKIQCSKSSSNGFLSNNLFSDKKSYGNNYNNNTLLQAPAGSHGNKVVDVTSKWGKYLPMDDEDNDDDFDSLLNQSLDIGTPKLKSTIESLREISVFRNSNDSNSRKSNDFLRAPTLADIINQDILKNVPAAFTHGTKYTENSFDKDEDIFKSIHYGKFSCDPLTDKSLSLDGSESVMSGTEKTSQVIKGTEKVPLLQGFRRHFKSPLIEKSVYGNKERNFASPVIQEYGTEKDRTFPSPVLDEPAYGTQKGRKFASPVIQDCFHQLISSKRNLAGELQFASRDEIERNPVPSRQVQIPVCFPSVAVYKNVLIAVLKEHLNIILFELSKRYHHTLAMIDTTGYGLQNTGGSEKSNNPACNCGAPSKIIQVKKDGANKGRFFYACNAARNAQCKFFQWADQSGKNNTKGNMSDSKIALNSGDSITTFFRSQHITLYADCIFLKKNVENIMHHFKKTTPEWVKRRTGINDTMNKKKMYVQLSKKDPSSMFTKDDFWIVSHQLHFEPSSTFLARSTYYGPNSSNEVEIEPMAGFSASNWSNHSKCHCILVGNISSELSYLQNIQENINPVSLPVMPNLLNRQDDMNASQKSSTMKGFKTPLHQISKNNLHTPDNLIIDLAGDFITRYHLNEDQSAAINRVATMFCKGRQLDSDPILLIHGVFGAGKSYLLSVIVLFLVRVFELNASYTPGVPFDWKILISSTTNVAVDRILNGLLQLDFEDFVRVGSIKKIAKPVLPYSVHATGTDSQELKDLQEMLRSGDATPQEKHHIRRSIEKHRLGENKKKLSKVKVVGVTCAASAFSCLDSLTFPVVLIDESSQMTEPSSLLPIAKFGCHKLLLVGDPKQLDPAVQGSEAAHDQGLEQTLFDRLTKLGYEPTVLRTQYRCHPVISNIANTLFYGGCLIDGISQEDRLPLVDEFPTLCFYDVSCGKDCSDSAGSYYNQEEADFVVFLIQVLICSGVEPCNIGVITLYKSQMYKIIATLGLTSSGMHKEVKSILVSTVDAFQGGERDVIILSCVRTNNVGFIDNEKRTNVALTRAKHHLLIVGNLNNLSKNNLWSSVIQLCKDFPGGIENSSCTRQRLQYIIDNASQDSNTDINDTESTASKRKSKKTLRKNKTSISSDIQNSCSPPMSLSESGTQQSDDIGSEELLSCSNERKIPPSNKVEKKRKSKVIDPFLLDSDKENSEDEDFPKLNNM